MSAREHSTVVGAKALAEQLVFHLGLEAAPVNVFHALERRGIDVNPFPTKGENILGAYTNEVPYGPTLSLSNRLDNAMRRLIGAELLYYDVVPRPAGIVTARGRSRRLQPVARAFGTAFLMPSHLVQEIAELADSRNAALFAEILGVQYDVAWQRLRSLGLLAVHARPPTQGRRQIDIDALRERRVQFAAKIRERMPRAARILGPQTMPDYYGYCSTCSRPRLGDGQPWCWSCGARL